MMEKRDLPRGLIGVVHLRALPGDPLHDGGGFAAVERFAMGDALALARGGADALILENFGSVPFEKGSGSLRIPPHQIALMALLARRVVQETGLPLGVNCLRNDALSAMGIAAAAGACFIRVNVHTGAMLTDQGLIEGEAHRTLRYRQALGTPAVAILADVLVKHAAPLAPLDITQAVQDTVHRGLADGVIVTGRATGAPVDLARLEGARAAAGSAPVYLGSGLTPHQALAIPPGLITGAIVGTWLKQGGDVRAPVDEVRVAEMASAVHALLA